ncbi:MAG: amino acid permease [Candidatus Eisenbacteria bacterium]|nr:amino acid permease [Candidatus Eisenbacteria bacterium]
MGLWDGISISVGAAIGAGILRTPGTVANELGIPELILFAWLLGGLIALVDALVLAELSTLFPFAGGWYVYIEKAFGRLPAFLYGWAATLIIYPASVAALGVVFGEYLGELAGFNPASARVSAVVVIAVLAILNYLGLKEGKIAQRILTGSKVLFLLILSAAVVIFGARRAGASAIETQHSSLGLMAFAVALQSILWTYAGYGDVVTMSEEVKASSRVLPRSLVRSTVLVISIYLILNFSLLRVLGNQGVASSVLPARDAAVEAFSSPGKAAVELIALFIILGGLNSQLLTGPRVVFALSRAGLAFRQLSNVNEGGTPNAALLLVSALAIGYAVSGTFESLLTLTIFVIWLSGLLVTLSLFVFRKRFPDLERPFKIPAYPFLPALLVLFALVFLALTFHSRPRETVSGIVFIAIGVPSYFIWNRVRRRARAGG